MNLEVEVTEHALTPLELERGAKYLTANQEAIVRETSGLSEAQWNFKPAPDRWSVAENVEHLAIVGNRVESILARLEQAPAPPAGHDGKMTDEGIVNATSDASTKFQAPPIISPSGRCNPASALEQFLTSCASVNATLHSASTPLRGHVVSHPVVGPLDGYQWILLVAAHIARHTKQILEVKSHVGFPAF